MISINFFLLFALQLIIISLLFLPNISYEQFKTKQDRSMEYVEGKPYYKYENPELDLYFKYPVKWKLYENLDKFSHIDKVISFNLQGSNLEINNTNTRNKLNLHSSSYPPIVNILVYKSKIADKSISELAKIKIQDLKNLFHDYDFNLLNHEINYIHENIRVIILQYSIEYYLSSELIKDKRITLDILIPRGEKIYEIEYIASNEEFIKNIKEVTKFIDSIKIW